MANTVGNRRQRNEGTRIGHARGHVERKHRTSGAGSAAGALRGAANPSSGLSAIDGVFDPMKSQRLVEQHCAAGPVERDGRESNGARKTSPLLNIQATARRLGVCEKTVRRLIERGELCAHKVGRQHRISEDDLARFLQECRR